MPDPFDAVVLLAHGARDARWTQPFVRMRDVLEPKLAPAAVRLAFMQFATPTLAEVVAELAEAEHSRVLVVPVFLSGGGHVAVDIPALVAPLAQVHPQISFLTCDALGEQPEVVQAMADAVVRLARRQ
jgi:sirohydrochlorin cobaltochelatase